MRMRYYIDPPYFNANMGDYEGYTKMDFETLFQLLSTLKGKFMLSSYPSEILSEYTAQHGWKMIEFELPRSASGGRKVEVLTMNYEAIEVGISTVA